MWDFINPYAEFRKHMWYLQRAQITYDRWREKNPPSASYVRHMKDAGRSRLL